MVPPCPMLEPPTSHSEPGPLPHTPAKEVSSTDTVAQSLAGGQQAAGMFPRAGQARVIVGSVQVGTQAVVVQS